MLIFCYGTLKRDYHNHRIIKDAKFVGEFVTKNKYKLFCNGAFPYMVDGNGKGKPVKGEVFEVNEEHVKRMDRLEGHPNFYKRQEVEIEGLVGVQGYIYQGVPGNNCRECVNGSWPIE